MIDIQDIPYEDSSFDMVIANYMLYHVPDISKALSEVRRVLKDDGIFYAGTAGENGIMENLIRMLGQEMFYNNSFSLENGEDKLKQVFSKIDIERYPDSLAVTNIDDLMDYIYSGITFKNECTLPRDEVRAILTGKMVDGVLMLPKDPGMFVARGIA
ncbi:MAG: methyltransferase domain-containing protein [Butyrivibrio sp.]|nr:methyltransferase domain-containing protein [Butyrivibrio sp.]